jgi:hypothetical protein
MLGAESKPGTALYRLTMRERKERRNIERKKETSMQFYHRRESSDVSKYHFLMVTSCW